METFKTILSNPGYEISNKGTVRNKETHKVLNPTSHTRKGRNNPTVYLRAELKNPRKKYLVHRLVAIAFIPNPDNLRQVNHRDENGQNNEASNFEWCESIYNTSYSQGVPVEQCTKDGIFINIFETLSDAARKTQSDVRLISAVCRGKRNTHNNYIWKYA